MNPRKIILDALIKFFSNTAYSNLTLDGILNETSLEQKDKAFVSHIFYGVIERKITLDYIISSLSTTKLNKMSPYILNALRMGLYQIIYMDKIPDNAAVNETVNLIKKSKFKNLSGFVNAILRAYLRKPVVLPNDDSLESMEIKYSCPKELVNEFIEYLGKDDAIKFLENSLITPPVYARVNSNVISEDKLIDLLKAQGIEAEKTNITNAIKLNKTGAISKLEEHKKGYFHIQDLASQIAISALSPKEDDMVLDICSAPGGKTFTMAEYMNNKGKIISCDIHNHRVNLIKNGAERLNLSVIEAIQNDATKYNKNFPKFDKILCDVPCSGYGDIRRKPEIKYKSLSDLTSLPDLQYNILNISASYLKSGGYILYSTCTLRKQENEDIVERFLKENSDFSKVTTNVFGNESEYQRLLSSKLDCDGFFFALLKKEG